mgnify:CR=1 FL=1
MKHTIIASILTLASFSCSAQANLLVGKFGHGYSKLKGTPVWEVTMTGNQLNLVTLNAEEPTQPTHELSDAERRRLWQAMWWPEETSITATCVGNSKEVLCHVPSQTRSNIGGLKSQTSNYFYFDPIVGLMEIMRISN